MTAPIPENVICCHGGKPHQKGDSCFDPEIPKGKHRFVLQRHYAQAYLNTGYTSPQYCGRCQGRIDHKGWHLEPCYGRDRNA